MELFRIRLPAEIYGTEATRIGLLRQNSAFIIPVIEGDGDRLWTVLGEEFRAGAGMRLTGFAAGSNDRAERLRALAERELHEEVGIEPGWIEEIRLIPTFRGADFVSPGATNEQVALYEARVRLPHGVTLESLHAVTRGVAGEAESVTSHVRELAPPLFHELHNTNEKLGLLLLLLDRARRAPVSNAVMARLVEAILGEAEQGGHDV